MPVCLAMGEAAGMAAAHAIKPTGVDVHAVDTDHLRRRLIAMGAYLPKPKQKQFTDVQVFPEVRRPVVTADNLEAQTAV
jgi:hypothetical protein